MNGEHEVGDERSRRPGGADGTLAAMSCWQYAQLTITVDGRASREGPRSIVWHDPGQGVGENYSDSGQMVLELLNRSAPMAESWRACRITGRAGTGRRTGRRPGC